MQRSVLARRSAIVFAALSLVAPSVARANGRFPGAGHLVFQPGKPSTLAVRTTFGFLLSNDAGARFRWICEEIVGYGGQQDPAIALFGDGTLISAALEGAFVSHDGGCSLPAHRPCHEHRLHGFAERA